MLLNEADVERYENVVAKAVDWLRQNHEKVMQLPDVSSHYKAPYLYATVGERMRAREHVDIIVERYQQPDGDFRISADDPGWPQEPAGPANRYVYCDSWLVVGFQKMGLYGPARKTLEFLQRFQDAELGGFRSRFDLATGKVVPRYLDVASTSVAGLALLACGQTTSAARAAEFVLRVLGAPGNLAGNFFVSWDNQSGLMMDVFGETSADTLRGRKQFCVSAEADAGGEPIWMVGLAMTFLSRTFDVTRDERFLDGARRLLDFFHTMGEARWENLASCKIMWGGAELYRLTGERKHGQDAKRILDRFCETQQEWGGWVHNLWFSSAEEQPFGATVDIINELCGEITETVFNLAGRC